MFWGAVGEAEPGCAAKSVTVSTFVVGLSENCCLNSKAPLVNADRNDAGIFGVAVAEMPERATVRSRVSALMEAGAVVQVGVAAGGVVVGGVVVGGVVVCASAVNRLAELRERTINLRNGKLIIGSPVFSLDAGNAHAAGPAWTGWLHVVDANVTISFHVRTYDSR
jgi:hypothetical protein